MRLPQLALCGLLLGSPLLGLAQTTEPTPAPRFYVGLGAYSSFYQKLGSQYGPNSGFRLPVQLTAGYQLRPRLALQLGVAYSGTSDKYNNEGIVFTSPGVPDRYIQSSGTSSVRTASVSALARYTLTRDPARRLQFDALGGFGLETSTVSFNSTRTESQAGATTTESYSYHGTRSLVLGTLGLGARYRVAPRFDLSLDVTANYAPAIGSNRYVPGLTSATALGLRYRFGNK